MPSHLLLPDAWRIQLLRNQAVRDSWLDALDASTFKLVDWETPRLSPDDELIVAGLDLSAAELVVKLPATLRVHALDVRWTLPLGPAHRFVKRAQQRLTRRISIPGVGTGLPPEPRRFLQQLAHAVGAKS